MRRRGEVAISVSLFLVSMLERDGKRKSPSVLIGRSRSAPKLGNKHGDYVHKITTRCPYMTPIDVRTLRC